VHKLVALAIASALTLSPSVTPSGAQAPEGACEVLSADVSWGFKESFRSYISGAIALGQWSTSGDVDYATPSFTFSGGEGFVMPTRSAGEIGFEGDLVFTGHGGILNTTLANPRIVITGPRSATLVFDVTGDTMEMVSVQAEDVDFATLSWSGANENVTPQTGVWEIADAEVVLKTAGAEAFGTYLAGEVFDPMDISLRVTPGCLGTPVSAWWWVGGGVAITAVGAAVVAVFMRRARKSREPEPQ
jgi:hypothetical protein